MHRWLDSLHGQAASPAGGSFGAFTTISPLIDRPRMKGACMSEPSLAAEIEVGFEDGACHVVCAGCSPLGRHALRPPHQSEVMRPRLVHLLRTRTCPEPLPLHSSPGKVFML